MIDAARILDELAAWLERDPDPYKAAWRFQCSYSPAIGELSLYVHTGPRSTVRINVHPATAEAAKDRANDLREVIKKSPHSDGWHYAAKIHWRPGAYANPTKRPDKITATMRRDYGDYPETLAELERLIGGNNDG